jgi:putative aldouronate transport system substrate-binding protein
VSDAHFIEDKAGAVGEFVTRTMGRLMDLARPKYPDYSFVAAPWPLGPSGKRLLSWRSDTLLYWTRGVAVTTRCKSPDRAVQYLDFWFSDEGDRMLNFGIEGDTYTLVKGKPTYTERITKNPDGISVSEARAMFLPVTDDMVGIERVEGFMQFLVYPEQIEAMEKVWSVNDGALGLPQLSLGDADSQRIGKLMGDITTYRDESMNKFIMGLMPLGDFDGYVSTIKKMGIEEVIAIYQTAVNDFRAR